MDFDNLGEEVLEVAEQAEVEEGAEEQGAAEPVSTKTDADSAFAQLRRDNEDLRRQLAEAQSGVKERDDALGLFFNGENKIAEAKAHFEQRPVEDIIREMDSKRTENELRQQAENASAENKRLSIELAKRMDIDALRAEGVEVKDFSELGEDFMRYRVNGMGAKEAYDFMQARNAKNNPPKQMGKVATSKPEKETFTRDEVLAMSPSERIKNYDKIRKSMGTW